MLEKLVVLFTLSDKFSVFVTPNTPLIKHTNKFLSSDIDSGIPVIISDTWLTTIFWLKHQETYEDLPAHSLVSHAYATLNQSSSVWNNFLARFKKLNTEGVIDNETVDLVRYHKNLLKEVNDYSIEIGDDFSDESVLEIVKRIEVQKEEDKKSAVESAVNFEQKKFSQVSHELSRSNSKIGKFESFIDSTSRVLSLILAAILGFFLIVSFYVSLKGLDVFNGQTNIVFAAATFITIALNLLGAIWGITLISIYKKLSKGISQWLKTKILDDKNFSDRIEPLISTNKTN